jgi:Uri superfamily endonuclease
MSKTRSVVTKQKIVKQYENTLLRNGYTKMQLSKMTDDEKKGAYFIVGSTIKPFSGGKTKRVRKLKNKTRKNK